jgi:uncharacterized metal-binding protein YceD (DUF177 family)
MKQKASPELSRRVELARLGSRVAVYRIAASAEERSALARRFDLLGIDLLEAEVQLERLGQAEVRLNGTLNAEVVQACVVTLDPVASTLSERFSMRFGAEDPQARVTVALEDELIEPIEDDAIDIGEAIAQQLALLLDPYPRVPGASLGEVPSDAAAADRDPPER